MSALDSLFSPKGIAVIGASASPEKAGYAMMESLSGFPGELYPINPRGGEILGFPAFASVGELASSDQHSVPDLAVLVVPPAAVPAAIEECGRAGIPNAMICSGGFAESGDEGAELQQRIVDVAAAGGVRILGPNTSGFINPVDGVCANFMPAVRSLTQGPVSVVAQSGGVNLALSFLLAKAGIGVRLAVGLGNAIDVDFTDVLYHLADDPETKAVGLHVEGVAEGRELMAAVRAVAERKPIVVLKVGKNDIGDFAKSHTGALTGSYQLTRQALAQAGAVIVDDPTQLVDALTALGHVRLEAAADPGVGIITGQAGPGLIIADQLASRGAAVPPLAEASVATIGTLLPPLTYQRNPVDTGRPGATFPAVVAAVSSDAAIDLIGVYALDEPGALDPVEAIRDSPLPVLFASGGPEETMRARRHGLATIGAPLFESPDGLARGLAAVVDDARAQRRLAIGGSIELPPAESLGRVLDEDESKALFEKAGLTLPQRRAAGSHDEAAAALAEIGGPVVVKVLDASITHKSDVGGVHVGVSTAEQLAKALETIDAIPGDGPRRYLIEQQAPKGVELIVGGIRDDAFGPVVLLSVGGVDVELGGEPILTVAPLSRELALDAIERLPQSILEGHRGAAAVDRDALATVLVAVSDVLTSYSDIREIDLNPVRVTSQATLVLDALIVL